MTSASVPVTTRLESPRLAPWQGWLPLAVLPAAVLALVPSYWPRWAFMWLLIAAIYLGFKWATWRRTPATDAPTWKHVSYLLLWLGLDAAAFLGGRSPPKPTIGEWLLATVKLAIGAALLWIVGPRIAPEHPLLVGWVGMIGITLAFHFGALHLLSCFWRQVGVNARPIMDWPIAATSVSEFWGRRWNTAFRDLAHQFFFRPVVQRFGGGWAMLAAFVFSGLIHDVAVSLPAGGGYGLPTLYFLWQAAAVAIERSRVGKALGLGSGWRGWLFAGVAILGPVYWAFHPPFATRVIVPFMQVIGAAQ
jgi:hypothetical protein